MKVEEVFLIKNIGFHGGYFDGGKNGSAALMHAKEYSNSGEAVNALSTVPEGTYVITRTFKVTKE